MVNSNTASLGVASVVITLGSRIMKAAQGIKNRHKNAYRTNCSDRI